MTALHHLAYATVALCACGGAKPTAAPGDTAPGGPPITTLATAQGYPINIRGDAGGLFWTNHLGGQIVALAAGGAPRVLADHQDYPLAIAIDQTDV
jgi:sugar lactone lactonase YvrE